MSVSAFTFALTANNSLCHREKTSPNSPLYPQSGFNDKYIKVQEEKNFEAYRKIKQGNDFNTVTLILVELKNFPCILKKKIAVFKMWASQFLTQ